MKLIIDIPEDVYTECQGHIYFPDTGGELFNAVKNATPLDGITNGEVFQVIFPCDEVHVNGLQEGYVHFSMKSNLDSMDCFDLGWWNAPYKAEREVKPND